LNKIEVERIAITNSRKPIQIIEKIMNAKNQTYKQIEQSKQQINERILKIQQNQSLKPSKNFPKQNPRTGTDPKIPKPNFTPKSN
jgi:hypothetical protein